MCELLTYVAAVVICLRSMQVLNQMHFRGRAYWRFLGIGSSYIALTVGAVLVSLTVLHARHVSLAEIAFLLAATGLIVLDRRAP